MRRASRALIPSENGSGFNTDRRVSRLSAGITGNIIASPQGAPSPGQSPQQQRRSTKLKNGVGGGNKSPMEKRLRRSRDGKEYVTSPGEYKTITSAVS